MQIFEDKKQTAANELNKPRHSEKCKLNARDCIKQFSISTQNLLLQVF